ncbi:DnaJ domain-containing protein [Gammaproteobacteria bacterium]|nr:DnaJ domain-containing protein [Gammaproteobacteria bacterium]
MINSNYFKTLGVTPEQDLVDIKRSFKRLASKYHPDKNHNDTDAERIFIKIKTAYEKIMEYKKNG